MSGKDFKAALRELGMSQKVFSERLQVSFTTVSRWATGELAVPGYAVEYLRVLGLAHQILGKP